MKTVIVYYSLSGNCEYTAKKAAEILGADLIRLEPVKAYPDSGFKKYFWGGKSAVMGEKPRLAPYDFDAGKYDRVILSFPVWAGSPTPPINSFIQENRKDLVNKKLAVLACFSGGGGDKAIAKLKAMLGVDELEAEMVLVDPKDKPDPDKDHQIETFCKGLEG